MGRRSEARDSLPRRLRGGQGTVPWTFLDCTRLGALVWRGGQRSVKSGQESWAGKEPGRQRAGPARAAAQLQPVAAPNTRKRAGRVPGGLRDTGRPTSSLPSLPCISPDSDNQRERGCYQSCFSRHHPVASRPQSCVAGPPAGAGHHCSPVQSCPQSPGVPPT